jgi:predicted signal transduction protein with EAL and GGDEF domain
LADRLIATISTPFMIDRRQVQVGASIGVAIYGADAGDADTLMSHADIALYRAKAEGRQTYRFYSDAMEEEVRARVALTSELRVAIPGHQLFAVYQPQVTAKGGILMPDSFLPVAESSGLIVALDHWMLREACRQGRQWVDAGISPGMICVNLSSAQFKTPLELETFVLAVLEETGLPAHLLELEITENTLIGFSSEHREMIQRLRGAGVRFSLDDFGTGYSSLNYLRRFPVDRIKIAREFVADLASSADAATIVKLILDLSRHFGNKVIAEGVETPEQLRLLQEWDCPDVQGFYFAAPMPAEAMEPLLRAGTINPARPD